MNVATNQQQRERKRRNSDRSEDGYHSDGDYPDQDYRREPGEDKKSKTIMLWGLSPHVTEEDVSRLLFLSALLHISRGKYDLNVNVRFCFFPQIRFAIDHLEGPQPIDVRLMKKKTGESQTKERACPPSSLWP